MRDQRNSLGKATDLASGADWSFKGSFDVLTEVLGWEEFRGDR